MEVTAEMVKELREKTGAGVMECKKVLTDTSGDINKAMEALKLKGLAIAEKKAARVTRAGVIEAYVHPGAKVGVLLEVNCETDFVAKTPEFTALAHDLALQIAAMSPKYVAVEDVPQGTELNKDGTKFNPETDCLLSQVFIKDQTKTITNIIVETIAKVGENIKVARFVRFELGA